MIGSAVAAYLCSKGHSVVLMSRGLAIGIAIAYRPTSRLGLYAAIGISLIYAVIGTLLVPPLWADPLGAMLKIWPIIVMHFVALAILDDR